MGSFPTSYAVGSFPTRRASKGGDTVLVCCVCDIDVFGQSIVFAVLWRGFPSFLVAKLCVLSFVAVKAWLDLADLWFMSFSYLVISLVILRIYLGFVISSFIPVSFRNVISTLCLARIRKISVDPHNMLLSIRLDENNL